MSKDNLSELTEALRAVKVTFPKAQWDTDDDGNIVILTHAPLVVN